MLYALLAALIYLAVIRPLLHPHSESIDSSDLASPSASTSSGKRKPLHQRRTAARAPLPPHVVFKTTPPHPIEHGLLKVDPESKLHPIYQLIRDAREQWDQKVQRQSKSLRAAVDEYQRRYHQRPPKGFDKWWAYVVENDVQMPDEYDQINRDLLPFRALSPTDLRNRITAAAHSKDTYTLKIKRGSLRTSAMYDDAEINGADARLAGQAELIRPIASFLPDLEVVYSVHDTPMNLISWDHRRELLEHVEEDEWIAADDEIDLTLRGFSNACPPNSPMRKFNRYAQLTSPTPRTSLETKKFVSSHSELFDLCAHPELVPLHGAVSGKNPVVHQLQPIFSLSKTNFHADVLGVPTEQWVEDIPDLIPFEKRKNDRLMWRGSNTGAFHSSSTTWSNSHRARLVRFANWDGSAGDNRWGAELGVHLLPRPKAMSKGGGKTLKQGVEDVDWLKVMEWMDVGFVGKPIQCEDADGTCQTLSEEFPWLPMMSQEDALQFKYIVDVDGNAWSARFKRLLTSGSLIFKSTIMPEWWTDRIQPWVHYVPIQMDYSDLYDALTFFRPDPAHPGAEATLGADIAAEGREWSLTHWRKEDMVAYVFRLYLEWGRLVADRRGAMGFEYDEDMEMLRH
ncbi:hypothetical protein BCR39DRAFT_474188 [Naematelia encephala]|uniref:Glycosyl transferase CAP10 domain-containing protein n=1 Tax=Naematelia encephala TaxID=71784 RepID=A0A1Y2AHD2_9TREE|nr:hypothetical protein BCR39DRAFT_474188 [Naematelia encephala]